MMRPIFAEKHPKVSAMSKMTITFFLNALKQFFLVFDNVFPILFSERIISANYSLRENKLTIELPSPKSKNIFNIKSNRQEKPSSKTDYI